jgi:hypothetical protein
MDPLFLLTAGSGEVAKFFNRTTRLDLIDRYTELCAAKQRKSREEQKRLSLNVDSLQKNIASLSYVGEAEKILAEYATIPEFPIIALQDSIDEFIHISEKINKNCGEQAQSLISEIDAIAPVQYGQLTRTIELYKQPQPTYLDDAIRLISRIDAYPEPNSSLEASIASFQQSSKTIKTLVIDIETTRKELPSICPTCGEALHDSNC